MTETTGRVQLVRDGTLARLGPAGDIDGVGGTAPTDCSPTTRATSAAGSSASPGPRPSRSGPPRRTRPAPPPSAS